MKLLYHRIFKKLCTTLIFIPLWNMVLFYRGITHRVRIFLGYRKGLLELQWM
jgi:hypothetical protein